MKNSKKFLQIQNLIPIFEDRIPSKSEPGTFHNVGLFADGRWRCSCIGFEMTHKKHLKKTGTWFACRHIKEAKERFIQRSK